MEVPAVPVINRKENKKTAFESCPAERGRSRTTFPEVNGDAVVNKRFHVLHELLNVVGRDDRQPGLCIENLWHGSVVLFIAPAKVVVEVVRPRVLVIRIVAESLPSSKPVAACLGVDGSLEKVVVVSGLVAS